MSARATGRPKQPRSTARTQSAPQVLSSEPSCILKLAGGDVYIIDLNVGFAQRFDLDPDLARGQCVRDLLSADAALSIMHSVRRCLSGAKAVKLTVSGARSGVARLVRLSLKRLDADSVLATALEAVMFGRRQSDKDMLETLGAVDGGVIFILDMKSMSVLFATERIEEVLGHPRSTLEGMVVDPSAPGSEFFQAVYHPDDAAAVAIYLSDLRNSRDDTVLTILNRVRHPTKGWRWLETRSRVLTRDDRGAVERAVGFSIDVTEQRQLSADLQATSFALLQAEETERRRIAREIHDSTAQHLVALDLGLSRLENIVGPGLPAVREWMDEMRGLTRTAHQELRVATFALHPPELEQNGLADTLRDLIRGFGRRTGLVTEFHISGSPRPMQPAGEHALLRISQEALLNIHKHARAKVATLRLLYEDTGVTVEIEDDGIGSDGAPNKLWESAGVGLQSMKARLAALGGVLSIVAGRSGFLVRACVHEQD